MEMEGEGFAQLKGNRRRGEGEWISDDYFGNNNINNNNENNIGRRSREDDHETRLDNDNMDGGSGDDNDDDGEPPKKKPYHRNTPQQAQELESFFKECPHPNEKQKFELSKRLCLKPRQVKFWFQNRRTQVKAKLERQENSILRQENDKLRVENVSIREAIRNRNPMCKNCGGPVAIRDLSLEEQHLRNENARLKDEIKDICSLDRKSLSRPSRSIAGLMSPIMPNSSLDIGNNSFPLCDFGVGVSSTLTVVPPANRAVSGGGVDRSLERSMYLELALAAMDELVKMAQTDDPLWFNSYKGGRDVLNHEEYMRAFNPCIGLRPNGFVCEASRETGMVMFNSLALVDMLMDSNRWAEIFPCVIGSTTTRDVITSGTGETRDGALQLMHAKLQVLSPFVPVREVNFLRFCKQHVEGVWAVVDVSIDGIRESSVSTFNNCRRLPSGCVAHDMPNGYSKVTWVEHAEHDENVIRQLYRPLIGAGMGFGAQRWVATLQRQCECLAMLSSAVPTRDHSAITASCRQSLLKLAQRMTNNYCAGVCASTVHKWNKLSASDMDDNVQVMTRKNMDDPGEPCGIVLSASTSVWLPVSPRRLFDFLGDEQLRSKWDILSTGGQIQEIAHIAKGEDLGNCVSLLRASAVNKKQSSMLILKETSIDAAGSLVVYAAVNTLAMNLVMDGGDSAHVALLPSGFVIVPGDPNSNKVSEEQMADGSLLTVACQILVNSLPTAKLSVESVESVKSLISCTVQKIRAALQCET